MLSPAPPCTSYAGSTLEQGLPAAGAVALALELRTDFFAAMRAIRQCSGTAQRPACIRSRGRSVWSLQVVFEIKFFRLPDPAYSHAASVMLDMPKSSVFKNGRFPAAQR